MKVMEEDAAKVEVEEACQQEDDDKEEKIYPSPSSPPPYPLDAAIEEFEKRPPLPLVWALGCGVPWAGR